jgi:hypothetical protein
MMTLEEAAAVQALSAHATACASVSELVESDNDAAALMSIARVNLDEAHTIIARHRP